MGFSRTRTSAGLGYVYGAGYFFSTEGAETYYDLGPSASYVVDSNLRNYTKDKSSLFGKDHIALHMRLDPGAPVPIFHSCWLVLPAVFSHVPREMDWDRGCVWIWDADADGFYSRFARVHAFDAEVGIHLIFYYLKAGFSPGEFVDFLLGWFGIDCVLSASLHDTHRF